MKKKSPVYTEKTMCRDCYKCVRNCPVKAIEIVAHSASVIDELCIACGKCINTCPQKAKKYRSDKALALKILSSKNAVASLAPSFVAEYGAEKVGKLIAALKRLGFINVSETAIGADIVSEQMAKILDLQLGFYISTACPVIVDRIRKYHPELVANLTPCVSPAMAHARFLKEQNSEHQVIFIGPCVAKKTEADESEYIDCALTFEELNQLFDEAGILIERMDEEGQTFYPYGSTLGRLYPMDGGMCQTLRELDVISMHFSGLESVDLALNGIKNTKFKKPVFLELLACEGGCVNGPAISDKRSVVEKNLQVKELLECQEDRVCPLVEIGHQFDVISIDKPNFTDAQMEEGLRSIGKLDKKSELNCSGCGYNSCRHFVTAMLQGKAEASMCVSYMRQLAAKKANALMHSMPSGVIVVDSNLEIVDANRRFAELLGKEVLEIFDAGDSFAGADLRRIFDQFPIFEKVLFSGEKVEKRIRHQRTYLLMTVFPIEDEKMVGGILRDVTEPSMEREEIIKNTKEVIKKNLNTVQQIAYLLGENAAETEVMLNSIVEAYRVNDDKE